MQLSLFDIPLAKIELEELFHAYFEHVSGWWENIFYAKNYEKFTLKKRVLKNSELDFAIYN